MPPEFVPAGSGSDSGKLFGDRVTRLEDPALITGKGQFVDDIRLPETAHAAFVRSPHAHALILSIDKSAALEIDGVIAVYALADFRPHLATERMAVGLPSPSYKQERDRPVLADEEVVHVGEAVAIVVAESRYIAEDAASMVFVDYDPLMPVADCREALKPGATLVHRDAPHNELAAFDLGYGEVDQVFSTAPHVYAESFWQHRGGSHSIEGRGCVAIYNEIKQQLTFFSSTQASHSAKAVLVDLLGWDENRVRVITPDVGGGFGPKVVFYPEDISTALAAILLGRPVKWTEDRREHFIATTQERDQYWDVEVAVDDDGHVLGLRGSLIHDHGAYTARGINLAYNSALVVTLPYEISAFHLGVRLALTNKVPSTPVRGAGHPQGIFVMERMLDRAARELGIDRAEIRRRNLVPPEKIPYQRPLKSRGDAFVLLDSGDYPACMEKALQRAGYAEFRTRQEQARAEGRYIGIGIGNYVKGTGRGPFESVNVKIGTSGKILVYSGAAAMGQSTRTMLSQIVAKQLGGDMGLVEVVLGDTEGVSIGIGGSASRQTVTAGSSALLAATEVREKLLALAAHMLEASPEDLEIEGGEVRVKGVPDMKISLGKLANAVGGTPGYTLPGGIEPGMEATGNFVVDDLTFANGTQVVEVEVDVETGHVAFLNYVIVHDSGALINPMIVDGQVIGGAAHGIGNALYEWMGFDENAQPITTNFAEYLMVTATEMPSFDLSHMESPTPLNPLGVKGVGECGLVPATAAIISAIEDALSPFGAHLAHCPVTPSEIVALVQNGRPLSG
ncbi:MAG: carbon-monoxide dehydrogenase large subunit [Alphaproteobacteria bacterium]|jgi:carbon-monoxide dehydrogenase large subunit